LSEESSNIPYHERSKWNQYWLIDPLDGTKEFIKKNGEFTTNIALIKRNRPVFGMIHAPAINQTFWGGENMNSFYLRGSNLSNMREINVSESESSHLRVASSRSHSSNLEKKFFTRIGHHKVSHVGSSLKFCKVAMGEIDIYPRFGPTSEWDTAAGDAIVTFAGGCIITASGEQLRYNQKESLINPSFLVSKSKKLSKKYISLMNNG
jgi:3'(2'), 5'-bisphosphate nucleotidase